MSAPVKGSVIVADGNGRVTVISPTSDNQVLSLDSTDPKGAKFIDVKNILPTQAFKAHAAISDRTNSTTYETLIRLTVPGENTASVQSIDVVSFKDSGASSYDVRVMTKSGDVIAEANFTNNDDVINDMGTLNNLPANKTQIEIQVKKTGGNNNTYAHLSEATVNYMNV